MKRAFGLVLCGALGIGAIEARAQDSLSGGEITTWGGTLSIKNSSGMSINDLGSITIPNSGGLTADPSLTKSAGDATSFSINPTSGRANGNLQFGGSARLGVASTLRFGPASVPDSGSVVYVAVLGLAALRMSMRERK